MLSVAVVASCLAFQMVSSDGNNNNRYIFIDEHMNWIDANIKCMMDYNTSLATISSLFEHDEALSLCKSESCWIGLSNIFGSYAFIDQTVLTDSTTFCDTSSIISCASISSTHNNTNCHWSHHDCKDIQMPFLCNNIPSTSKCNYFVDSTTLLPHATDICSSDSHGMSTIYTCANTSDTIHVHTDSNCTSSMETHTNLSSSSYTHPFAHNIQCTASVCDEYDIVSVKQYNYTNNEKRCSQDDLYLNQTEWMPMNLVIVDKLFYNDSECTQFQFGATILSHNSCSNNGLFGYQIQECGTEMYEMIDTGDALVSLDYDYGYVNDGRVSKPINKCQSIYSYTMSYKYICVHSEQQIMNRIWFDNTDCNGLDYFDVPLSLDYLVDFSCNNRISTNIININYYQNEVDHNPSIVYTQSIIINQCFPINSTYSFRYKCTGNTTLQRLIFAGDMYCEGEAVLFTEDDETPWIGIPKCNMNDSLTVMGPPWTNVDVIDTHKKAKIFMFVLLALFVATCLMFAVFGILVWNYFKTQTGKTSTKSKKPYMDISGNTSSQKRTRTTMTETDPKSVVSYDVEDNGDLPGIGLWRARKRSSYSSQPVSENTATLPTLPRTPIMLLAVDSGDTCITNYTDKGMEVSTIMDGLESLRQFSDEYYEPSPGVYVD
eukprot:502433_1